MFTKILECDLVVLGAGGSGLVAAHRAFDLTGKKVIVLEKTRKPAGCTFFASGMGESGPIKDSTWQKPEYTDSGKCVIVNHDGKRWKNEGSMGGGANDGFIGGNIYSGAKSRCDSPFRRRAQHR